MSDLQLTVISGLVEIGVPLLLVILCVAMAPARRWAVVVLGAVTPLIVLYAWVTASHLLQRSQGSAFAISAIWVMTFGFFSACFLVGAVLGLSKRPASLSVRYLIGVASAPVAGLGLYVAAEAIL